MTSAHSSGSAHGTPRDDGPRSGERLRILAISFDYPPVSSPRAVQISRLLRHTDGDIALVTASARDCQDRVDSSNTARAESALSSCIRVPFRPAGWRHVLDPIAARAGLNFWNQLPDRYRSWRRSVVARIERHLAQVRRPHVLVTFGSPMSDHLIGLELKRRLNLWWLAHFSDPWADNPFATTGWLAKQLNLSMERRVIAAADGLVFTSEETIDLVFAKYPSGFKSKASVLPHCFEQELYPTSVQPADTSAIVIRYLGDLYGQRTPEPLFRALARLVADEPRTLHGVRFEFIGSTYDLPLSSMGLEALPDGLVVLRPSVPYIESLRMMTEATALLVVDAPARLSVFLPSKLVDYIGASRPVFAITPPGTSARVVTELGGQVADPADIPAVARALSDFIAGLRRTGGSAVAVHPKTRSAYEAHCVARDFQSLLERCR